MKQYFKLIVCFSLLLPCVACATSVTVKLKVIDENQLPVADAEVGMSFLLGHGQNSFKGSTNSAGEVNASREAHFGVSLSAWKENYYSSGLRTSYGDQVITLILREMKNPIAMYAKKYNGLIPKKDEKIGFDFTVGDWVSPSGDGTKADVYFEYTGDVKDFWNYQEILTISFPSSSDGIQQISYDEVKPYYHYSQLRLPHHAPEIGYENTIQCGSEGYGVGKPVTADCFSYNKAVPGYFLRIRSVVDKNGVINQAHYVKIAGSISYSGGYKHTDDKKLLGNNAASVNLTYYLNPTPNDRNMEFDPEKNLFKNLKNEERVLEP